MKRVVAVGVGAVIFLAGCSSEGGQESSEAAVEETTASTTEESATAEPLAAKVEKAVLDGNGVESFQELEPTSPGFYISQIEDVSGGTIRVYVQTELTEPERDDVARWVKNHSQMDELTTVVVRDSTGIDSNHFYN